MNNYDKIGENLKSIRNNMGLSLDEVSTMTGVSKTMLSQIERSVSVPTLATVSKITNGLKLRFDSLLAGSQELFYDIRNIDNITPVIDNDGKIIFYCIFPFDSVSGFEIFYCVLKPGCDHVSETHKRGRIEYMMVSHGELEILIGTKNFYLKQGSSIAFDAKEQHRYINKSNEDTILFFVLSYEP